MGSRSPGGEPGAGRAPVTEGWPGHGVLRLRTVLDAGTCLGRIREMLDGSRDQRAGFNGYVHGDRFELQRWWGWPGPARRALAGRVTGSDRGAIVELWVRPGLIAGLGRAIVVAAVAVDLLALFFITGSRSRTLLMLLAAGVGVAGLGLARWRDPLGEAGGERELVSRLAAALELEPEARVGS